jgi:hypothetical protein
VRSPGTAKAKTNSKPYVAVGGGEGADARSRGGGQGRGRQHARSRPAVGAGVRRCTAVGEGEGAAALAATCSRWGRGSWCARSHPRGVGTRGPARGAARRWVGAPALAHGGGCGSESRSGGGGGQIEGRRDRVVKEQWVPDGPRLELGFLGA